MNQRKKINPADPMICLCNGVPRSKIQAAIDRGCTSLGKIFDATRAGCGPCGGSCQYKLREMIQGKVAGN